MSALDSGRLVGTPACCQAEISTGQQLASLELEE